MLFSDFIRVCEKLDDPDYDSSRFDRLLEFKDDSVFDGINIERSMVSSIKRFYENTNEYNRSKISNLININIRNFEKVHRIVLDYEISRPFSNKESYE